MMTTRHTWKWWYVGRRFYAKTFDIQHNRTHRHYRRQFLFYGKR